MSAATTPGQIRSRAALPSWRLAASMFALMILTGFLALAPLRSLVAGLLLIALSFGLLIQPALGLVLIAVAIPWRSGFAPLPIGGVGVVDLLVGAVLVTWLVRGVAQREIKIETPALVWPLLAFVWIAGASLTQAISWQDGLPEWLKWVEFTALYVVGLQVLGPRSARVLIAALLLTGVSQSALGAYQFLRQSGPEGFILMGRFMRAYGTLSQPNPYAGYLGYLAPIAASLSLMYLRAWWTPKQPKRPMACILSTGATAALVTGIFMSWSRGAWLGLAAGLLTVIVLAGKRAAAIAAAAAVALIVATSLLGAGWIPDSIESRVRDLGSYAGGPDTTHTEITDDNFSVLERLAHWRAGWRMFDDRPWLGVGIGNYAASYDRYALPYWYDSLGHAHNVFINFMAETGSLGLTAFLALWLAVVWTAARYARHSERTWEAALAVGLVGTWVYLTVHSLFDNLFVQHLQLQLALLLVVLHVTQKTRTLHGEGYELRPAI